jgi:hypothetical protein
VGADGTGADPAKTQRDDVMVAMAAEDRLNVRDLRSLGETTFVDGFIGANPLYRRASWAF